MLFFFSSRRRHTRSKRDWSSDVCSSDLERPGSCARALVARPDPVQLECASTTPTWSRSEERRVGKECRYRWSPYQLKKKLNVAEICLGHGEARRMARDAVRLEGGG